MKYIVAYINGTGYSVMQQNSAYGYYTFYAKTEGRESAEEIAEALNGNL